MVNESTSLLDNQKATAITTSREGNGTFVKAKVNGVGSNGLNAPSLSPPEQRDVEENSEEPRELSFIDLISVVRRIHLILSPTSSPLVQVVSFLPPLMAANVKATHFFYLASSGNRHISCCVRSNDSHRLYVIISECVARADASVSLSVRCYWDWTQTTTKDQLDRHILHANFMQVSWASTSHLCSWYLYSTLLASSRFCGHGFPSIVLTRSPRPLYGKLSDIFGRKACLLVAYCIFALGCLLCGLSRTMNELIIARAIAGIGGGGMSTWVTVQHLAFIPIKCWWLL